MKKLVELYRQWSGAEPQNMAKLPGGGSNREYYRMTDAQGHMVVGCIGTSRDENHAFVYLCQHFASRHLPVPEILAVSDDESCYLQTDLGSTSLFDAIRGGREAGGRYTLKEQELLRRTIRELPNIQINGAEGLDFSNLLSPACLRCQQRAVRPQLLQVLLPEGYRTRFPRTETRGRFPLVGQGPHVARRRTGVPLS